MGRNVMALDNCFLYSKNDVLGLANSVLHGYAISENALIINTDGLNTYLGSRKNDFLPEEGRFCGLFKYKDKIIIKSDIHGQDIIYVYRKGTDWAISNSFMMLSMYASKAGKINFYQPAALNFFLKNGYHVGEQLLSHKTMIEEIEILPVNQEIHVDRVTGKTEFISTDFESRFKIIETESDYEDTIISMLSHGMSLLEAIVASNQDIYLSLSGGYDSRLVLGMISRGLIDSKKVYIRSDINREKDFVIAEQLCKKFGFNLNDFSPPKRNSSLSASESLRMFLLSCGGTYLPIYPVNSGVLSTENVLRLTGDYSADASFFSGKAMFNGSMRKISGDIAQCLEGKDRGGQVVNDFLTTFDVLGVDIDSPISSVAYYSAIRSRHHCGRQWYKTMGSDYLMTPLMSKNFTSLNLLNYSQSRREDELFTDIFCAMGKWATETPFESAKGNLDPNLIANSKFNAGVKFDVINYEIFGSFRDPKNNTISSLDLPLKFNFNEADFKEVLTDTFNRTRKEVKNDLFCEKDIERARMEISKQGRLSHEYRCLTHMLYVSLVRGLVEKS